MPFQKAVEAFLRALYRQWYSLPLFSTREPLETMRHRLAADLRAVPAGDTDRPRELVIALITALRCLPGVEEATASELRDLGLFLGGSLKPRLTDLPALIELLDADDSANAAIRAMVFIPGQEEVTLGRVREILSLNLDRLPAPTRELVRTTLQQVDAATLKPADALTALQADDVVLRVAWRELLPGKAVAIAKTLGGGTTRGSAQPPSSQAFAAPAAAPGAGIKTRYFTDVRFPQKIKRGERHPLLLRLTVNKHAESIAPEELEVEFADPAQPEFLEVVLDAPGFSEAFTGGESRPTRTMMVKFEQDTDPVVFWLKADKEGQQQISVDFYRNDKHIGGIKFEVEIVATGQTSFADVKVDGARAEVSLQLTDLPEPADLELRVVFDRKAEKLRYTLHSTKGEANYHWTDMGERDLLAGDAKSFFDTAFSFMGEIASFSNEDLTDDEIKEYLRKIKDLGHTLFEKLFSDKLQKAYWQIKKLHERGIVRSFLITTDEPWIPWELIKPYEYDDFDDSVKSGDYLGETFYVSRWLTGFGPHESITVSSAALVVPDGDLDYAGGEGQDFDRMAKIGVTVGKPLANRVDVLKVITEGSAQLLHFATHADFDADNPEQSPVLLEDGELFPNDLDDDTILALRRVRPIIFLNACKSGKMAYTLSGMDGWADRLVRKVRATAFIGTLWEVNDELAAQFAASFYGELLDGKRLGEAFHTARLAIRDAAPANPTWLAYTLYGDPNTRVKFGPQE